MKLVIISSLLAVSILPVNKLATGSNNSHVPVYTSFTGINKDEVSFSSQPAPEGEKMLAIVFKNQDYCRAELKDFDFDAKFSIVSATVYFSGANFSRVETATLNSNSFKSIRSLMARCIPGTIVVFDNVKVVGPDQQVRTIEGKTYLLR